MKTKNVTAIILVAGSSTRFGQNRNKNFDKVGGKEILLYSLEAFNQNELVDDIIIVYKKGEEKTLSTIIDKVSLNKSLKLVEGGATRQESVYNAITKTDSKIVIVHDGARPMIKQRFITECINEMANFHGATIAVKSKDTIKISDDNGVVEKTTLRKNTWIIQTPQCFNRETLLSAHEKYKDDETITDDCMLLEKENEKIKLIEGEYSNIKVTTFDDISLVNGYLNV